MNRIKHDTSLVILASCFWLPTTPGAYAWDGCGHKTVAAIALAQLDQKTQQKVNVILQNDPRGRHFIDAATWPDDIKRGLRNDLLSKAPLDKPWHFVDVPYDATPDQIDQEITNHGATVVLGDEKSANVVTAIRFYTNQLRSGAGDAVAKADALSWLIHLVGDVHQPLHCVTVVTPLANYTPPAKGDEGGNGFNIHHPARELHALWDDMFDEPTGGRHEEGRDSSDDNAKNIATQLMAKVTPDPAMVAKTDPIDWARESYSLRTFAYKPPLLPNPTAVNPAHTIAPAYLAEARADAEERVVLAGARLANLLKSIFGVH